VLTGTGRKLESAQRTSSPSASIPLTGAAGNPTNEDHQEGGHEAGEKVEVARMHVLGAGGVDGDEEGEGQPEPAHPHPPAAPPVAGRRRGGSEASPSRSLARSRVQLPRPFGTHPTHVFCLCYCVLGLELNPNGDIYKMTEISSACVNGEGTI
jgi:hypothetical protein